MIYEIVVDGGETPNKCTITPLASRGDFRLFPVRGEGPLGPLSAPILLHHEGECLSRLRPLSARVPALASVDCVWRRLPKLVERISWNSGGSPALVKIPEGFETVYPRVGLPQTDPTGGLATIEAIFIAAALLGNYDPSLLAKYYFGRRFLEVNLPRFLELGVAEAADKDRWPLLSPPARNAATRRHNRGRAAKSIGV